MESRCRGSGLVWEAPAVSRLFRPHDDTGHETMALLWANRAGARWKGGLMRLGFA